MNANLIRSLAAAAAVALSCSAAIAQQENGAQQDQHGGLVAVLDVAKVFEANGRFNARLNEIKQEAEQHRTKLEQEQLSLKDRAKQVTESFKPGSPEFKNAEAQLEQELASLRTNARQSEMDMLCREAKIYYDTYLEMQQVVASLAEQYGITLVIRFDSSTIDPTNRTDVIKGVNRAVIFQKNLDLTEMVIDRLKSVSSADMGRTYK